MGKSAALFALFLISQSVPLPAVAATTTIEPGVFANRTNISTLTLGVTLSEAAASLDTEGPLITVPLHLVSDFSGPVFASGSVFANSGGPIWSAGPCCTIHNALRADFADRVIRVAVEFLPDDNDSGVLQAYSVVLHRNLTRHLHLKMTHPLEPEYGSALRRFSSFGLLRCLC